MLKIGYVNVKEGIEELKRGIDIRNQMGGAMYWNMINDECLQLADKLAGDGVSKILLATIGDWELKY